ncbi:MAG: 2-phosphosulfolactate phosphatase [Chitinophagaceae bacterium]
MHHQKPALFTCLSPALLQLYDVSDTIVVIIDVLRATSTIATALFNGAECIIPVENVRQCIEWAKKIECITAGERDGQVAEGLEYGNSPFEYSRDFIAGKTLVLTTTNGTKLLHMALEKGATSIITGSFPNFSAVCQYLIEQKRSVILGCAAWKDKINLEDTLFAGAVINRVKDHFDINCDSSQLAEVIYLEGRQDMFEFLRTKNASHYYRLVGYGLQKDIKYCLAPDTANVVPIYEDGKLVISKQI